MMLQKIKINKEFNIEKLKATIKIYEYGVIRILYIEFKLN